MPRSWIYRIGRDALINQLERSGLDTTGNVNSFRCQLSEYSVLHPEYRPTENMPNPPERQIDAPDTVPTEPPRDGGNPEENRAKTSNQIRKWGCRFVGKGPFRSDREEK